MEGQNLEVQKLAQEATDWFRQINKSQAQEIMTLNQPPQSVSCVVKFFYTMVTDQPLNQNKDLVKVVNSSSTSKFDDTKLFSMFKKTFLDLLDKNQIISEFDPLKLSEPTGKYLKRLQVEFLQGPNPLLTDDKIKKTSIVIHKLWHWCKCMLEIRQTVLKDDN